VIMDEAAAAKVDYFNLTATVRFDKNILGL